MNLIHLNLMAGVCLDHQSKETAAMKSSGKMGNSPKFPAFLRAKWNKPAVQYVERSQVLSIPFECQSSHPLVKISSTRTFPKLKKEDSNPKQLGDLSNKISKD
jgi:hypothetical protein